MTWLDNIFFNINFVKVLDMIQDSFTPEQVKMLKGSAERLRLSLRESTDSVAKDFLKGELGNIINQILNQNVIAPFKDIPHFEKMTRDYLPDSEEEYFAFYSLAKNGNPAYKT
jgi:hypothetical protein